MMCRFEAERDDTFEKVYMRIRRMRREAESKATNHEGMPTHESIKCPPAADNCDEDFCLDRDADSLGGCISNNGTNDQADGDETRPQRK